MKNRVLAAALIAALGLGSSTGGQDAAPAAAAAAPAPPDLVDAPQPQSMALLNAQVFDGERFQRQDLFVDGGVLVAQRPASVDRELDLAGAFIIPALADSHTHRFSYSGFDVVSARSLFVRRGVLYLANVNCPANAREQAACCANRPDGPDVIFANGGFTATGGHPVRLYEFLHTRMLRQSGDTFMAANDDNTFFRIDTPADVDAKWPVFIATKPDIVKTYVLHSENFAERKDDDAFYGAKGLDPANLKLIVQKARAAGLRVATHVETAQDFRSAVSAGVDWLVHMPPYQTRRDKHPPQTWTLTPEDAREAARRGVMVTLTCGLNKPVGFAGGSPIPPEQLEHTRVTQAANVKLLKDTGVKLLFGSDEWNGVDGERDALHALGVLTPVEILRMWSMETPRAIFPGRRVGELEAGAEATLLVLDADPLAAPGNYTHIRLVLKGGAVIAERTALQGR